MFTFRFFVNPSLSEVAKLLLQSFHPVSSPWPPSPLEPWLTSRMDRSTITKCNFFTSNTITFNIATSARSSNSSTPSQSTLQLQHLPQLLQHHHKHHCNFYTFLHFFNSITNIFATCSFDMNVLILQADKMSRIFNALIGGTLQEQ